MLAHLPRDMGMDNVSVIKFDPELRIGKGFKNRTFHFNVFFFGHSAAYAPLRLVIQTPQYSGVNQHHPQPFGRAIP